ncbi:hypothetical protein AB6A40_009169 [Gnathostoma spinigerum]|uniref:Uncharacterized protein n=1 Tax=Gnathostoma spinigerum TaxID=75299 RepID=A0ABD6ER64_9BILA
MRKENFAVAIMAFLSFYAGVLQELTLWESSRGQRWPEFGIVLLLSSISLTEELAVLCFYYVSCAIKQAYFNENKAQ